MIKQNSGCQMENVICAEEKNIVPNHVKHVKTEGNMKCVVQ